MTPVFSFQPAFFLLDKNPNELRSIAVEKISDVEYEGVSFKEWNTGWSISPIKIGKGFISKSDFDFTESIDEAIEHAKIK